MPVESGEQMCRDARLGLEGGRWTGDNVAVLGAGTARGLMLHVERTINCGACAFKMQASFFIFYTTAAAATAAATAAGAQARARTSANTKSRSTKVGHEQSCMRLMWVMRLM